MSNPTEIMNVVSQTPEDKVEAYNVLKNSIAGVVIALDKDGTFTYMDYGKTPYSTIVYALEYIKTSMLTECIKKQNE